MDLAKTTGRSLLICLLLGGATLITFWPQVGHDFISYDDPFYLTENPVVQQGLTGENVAWAFGSRAAGNWHPVTWLSHMLDVQLFGLNPGWHHLVGLLFHTTNALLLFLLFQRMTASVWRSSLVAGLFALHPLHVQSVAWASERKDVLSAFFFLLTLLAYAQYAEASRSQSLGKRPVLRSPAILYSLSLLCFTLGLMSKPMLVTLPFILLLLDYWPLRRLQFAVLEASGSIARGLIVEKLPFFALSLASCAVTFWAQRGGGAVVPLGVLAFPQRLANALVTYVTYAAECFWPANLAILYPFGTPIPAWQVVGSGALLVAVTFWVLWANRNRSHPPTAPEERGSAGPGAPLPVGWFWFVGMLVPVIGLVQVGMQQRADRYTYLPLIGIFTMIAWGFPVPRSRFGRTALACAASLALLASAAVARHELGFWHDSERLFARALQVQPANYIALDNYARALLRQGKTTEAVRAFKAAIELRPDLDAARCGLGTALVEQGQLDLAAEQFTRVLELQPDHPAARLQLGIILGRQGKLEAAAAAFLLVLGQHPDDASAHNNLGSVLLLQGKHREAIPHFEAALRLRPANASAHVNLGICCRKLGQTGEAIAHYREALRLQPDLLLALNNLAWTLAADPDDRFRNGAEAVPLATRACELTRYENPLPLATLGAAYAETGHFEEAVAYAARAQELLKGRQDPLTARLPDMLEAFHSGRAYRGE